MKKLIKKIINWFKGLYFEFLLWLDKYKEKPHYYLTPREVKQIVREYSLLSEGVKKIKTKINNLVRSKTKEEYEKILGKLSSMIELAEEDVGSPRYKMVETLKQIHGNKLSKKRDIENSIDKIKMLNRRAEDFNELKRHKEIRLKIRKLRMAIKREDKLEAEKIKKELDNEYRKKRK